MTQRNTEDKKSNDTLNTREQNIDCAKTSYRLIR